MLDMNARDRSSLSHFNSSSSKRRCILHFQRVNFVPLIIHYIVSSSQRQISFDVQSSAEVSSCFDWVDLN